MEFYQSFFHFIHQGKCHKTAGKRTLFLFLPPGQDIQVKSSMFSVFQVTSASMDFFGYACEPYGKCRLDVYCTCVEYPDGMTNVSFFNATRAATTN